MQGAERPGYSGEKVKKDTVRNIEDTGEFVVNIATKDIAEAINICAGSYGAEINELEEAGLATLPSRVVKPPRRRKPGCFGVPTRTVHRAGQPSAGHRRSGHVSSPGCPLRGRAGRCRTAPSHRPPLEEQLHPVWRHLRDDPAQVTPSDKVAGGRRNPAAKEVVAASG